LGGGGIGNFDPEGNEWMRKGGCPELDERPTLREKGAIIGQKARGNLFSN
jgi:hypothetical protein